MGIKWRGWGKNGPKGPGRDSWDRHDPVTIRNELFRFNEVQPDAEKTSKNFDDNEAVLFAIKTKRRPDGQFCGISCNFTGSWSSLVSRFVS